MAIDCSSNYFLQKRWMPNMHTNAFRGLLSGKGWLSKDHLKQLLFLRPKQFMDGQSSECAEIYFK